MVFFEFSEPAKRQLKMIAEERKRFESGYHRSLNEWLIANDITDQEFADRCGATRGYISRVRRNMVSISFELGCRIMEVTNYEIPARSLFARSKQPLGSLCR